MSIAEKNHDPIVFAFHHVLQLSQNTQVSIVPVGGEDVGAAMLPQLEITYQAGAVIMLMIFSRIHPGEIFQQCGLQL